MSIESMLTAKEKDLRSEMQAFVKSIPRQLLLDMDAEKVTYPREVLQEAAHRKLLGLRFDPKWGGRGLPWTSEMVALEEAGTLGTSLACLYSLVSIVGEAIHSFGSQEQKEKYLKRVIAWADNRCRGINRTTRRFGLFRGHHPRPTGR